MTWKIFVLLILSIKAISIEQNQDIKAQFYCFQQSRREDDLQQITDRPKNLITIQKNSTKQIFFSPYSQSFVVSKLIAPRFLVQKLQISICPKTFIKDSLLYVSIIFESRGSALKDQSHFNRSFMPQQSKCFNISLGIKDDINKHPYTNMTIILKSQCSNKSLNQKLIDVLIDYSYKTFDQTQWIVEVIYDISLFFLIIFVIFAIYCFCSKDSKPNNLEAINNEINTPNDHTVSQIEPIREHLCPLCQKTIESVQPRTTKLCCQIFYDQFIDSWDRQNTACPVCRRI